MPPRRKKDESVTSTETPDLLANLADSLEETDEEPTPPTAEDSKRFKPEDVDALDLAFEFDEIPDDVKRTRVVEYKRTEFDDVMDQLWQQYLDAGSPHWSQFKGLTKEDMPEGGWYKDRKGITARVRVPNPKLAESMITRAKNRIGCSYRFRSKDVGGGMFDVWFQAAPILPNQKKDDTES